jgi:branched-chain amino acid transport system ATP-binding protein
MSLLDVQGVTRSFGGLRAVSNLSFTVERGSIVGLIGPNGAGKTTYEQSPRKALHQSFRLA